MRFSVIGFIIGAVCAIILYVVGTALLDFEREDLVFGLLAVALWIALTFSWPETRRGGPRAGL